MSTDRPDWDRIDQEQQTQYERLIDYLTARGLTAQRLDGDRIGVRVKTRNREQIDAEILMTPHEWENLADIVFGEFDTPAERLHDALLRLSVGHRYLVYDQYELVPQAAPELSQTTVWQREQHRLRRA